MKLNISNAQYRTLLRLAFIGDVVVNGIRFKDKVDEFEMLSQHIYSFAEEFGETERIARDPKTDEYYATDKLADESLQYVDEFTDDVFWEEIIARMARRDFVLAVGEETIEAMSLEERMEKEEPYLERYAKEFDEFGIDNLVLRTI